MQPAHAWPIPTTDASCNAHAYCSRRRVLRQVVQDAVAGVVHRGARARRHGDAAEHLAESGFQGPVGALPGWTRQADCHAEYLRRAGRASGLHCTVGNTLQVRTLSFP